MTTSNSVPTEYIVTKYFIKYSRLDQLIPYAFKGSSASSVNIYIDLYGIYKTLFSKSFRTDVTDYTALVTSVINMCAHYRAYFKYIRVSTKFFLISSYNVPEVNRKLVAGYNKSFLEKLQNGIVGKMVDINCELLGLLCPYLPDIHFLSTSFESTVLIDYLIRKEMSEGNNNPNIILSSDLYPMQLCSKYNDTVLLKPKKINGVDESEITTPKQASDHFETFWRIVCRARANLVSDAQRVFISTANYALLEALNRFPERNILNLINFNAANKMIYDVIGDSDNKIDMSTLIDSNLSLSSRYPREILEARYKALDISYQSALFEDSVESKTIHYMNLEDPNAVNLINSKYFQNNPIDVFRL